MPTTEKTLEPITYGSRRDTSSGLLATISRGKRPRHIFALVYGTDGVGKSTMCSHAPNPIFIGAEKGTEQLEVVSGRSQLSPPASRPLSPSLRKRRIDSRCRGTVAQFI